MIYIYVCVCIYIYIYIYIYKYIYVYIYIYKERYFESSSAQLRSNEVLEEPEGSNLILE